MRALSCPIRDLTGRQGGSLYYKGNQCQQATSLSIDCHGSFGSALSDRYDVLSGKNKLEWNKEQGDDNDSTSHAKNDMQWPSEVIESTVEREFRQKRLLAFTTVLK